MSKVTASDRPTSTRAKNLMHDTLEEGTPSTLLEMTDRYELMQYAGLKDRNGVEIYQGDIVRSQREGDHYDLIYYEVQMPAHKAAWYLHTVGLRHKHQGWKDISRGGYVDKYLSAMYDEGKCCIEVIGNIHENPDLLS